MKDNAEFLPKTPQSFRRHSKEISKLGFGKPYGNIPQEPQHLLLLPISAILRLGCRLTNSFQEPKCLLHFRKLQS